MLLVKIYERDKRRWVSVKQSVLDLEKLFDVTIEETSLGRKLANLKQQGIIKDHRNNPDSQYCYYIGPLDEN